MSPGFFRSILGDRRDFLVTTETGNSRLRPYELFLNARDYGNNLDIAWYLTFRPSFRQAILSLIPFINLLPKGPGDLDLFDQQDLRAYATNAHHSMLKAVDKLMGNLHQDPSTLDRKSPSVPCPGAHRSLRLWQAIPEVGAYRRRQGSAHTNSGDHQGLWTSLSVASVVITTGYGNLMCLRTSPH